MGCSESDANDPNGTHEQWRFSIVGGNNQFTDDELFVLFLTAPWRDTDLTVGRINGRRYVIENRPGALHSLYGHRRAIICSELCDVKESSTHDGGDFMLQPTKHVLRRDTTHDSAHCTRRGFRTIDNIEMALRDAATWHELYLFPYGTTVDIW